MKILNSQTTTDDALRDDRDDKRRFSQLLEKDKDFPAHILCVDCKDFHLPSVPPSWLDTRKGRKSGCSTLLPSTNPTGRNTRKIEGRVREGRLIIKTRITLDSGTDGEGALYRVPALRAILDEHGFLKKACEHIDWTAALDYVLGESGTKPGWHKYLWRHQHYSSDYLECREMRYRYTWRDLGPGSELDNQWWASHVGERVGDRKEGFPYGCHKVALQGWSIG